MSTAVAARPPFDPAVAAALTARPDDVVTTLRADQIGRASCRERVLVTV